MAAQKVLVEVALSSADQILGVKGNRHPLRTLLAFGVPVAIVTDDMGVSRSTHTQEFMKAVEEQGLDYRTMKALVRNSIEYSFADPATKTRLKTDLEKAFRTFEAGISKTALPGTASE
jgi:adenosine deaminase